MFKNAYVYRLKEFNRDDFIDCLDLAQGIQPIQPSQAINVGWCEPVENLGQFYREIAGQNVIISIFCLKIEEKKISPKALKNRVEEIAKEREKTLDRKLGRREKIEIKEIVEAQLMPTTLPVPEYIYAYFFDHEYLVINTGNAIKADLFTTKLRQLLGDLICRPLANSTDTPFSIVGNTIAKELEKRVILTGDIELVHMVEASNKVSYKHHGELADAIAMMEKGYSIKKMSLTTQFVEFTIGKDLVFKRVKLHGIEPEPSEDALGVFDADMALFALEFDKVLGLFFELFPDSGKGDGEKQKEMPIE